MQVYEVGGAVRDELLGLPVQDRDYVVVGATAQEMIAKGFKPVGKDFPVFLHPVTRAEYALARTERKSAPGYKGFVFQADPGVTLEEDLARRDLTINAMARAEDGRLIDPFGGLDDLHARVLRHVGPAFVEDPVRILRVARLAARFRDFAVAESTLLLMRAMVEGGEADHLVPERVWQELARGLMEQSPSRMVEVLRHCGALARLLAEVDRLFALPGSEGESAGTRLLGALDRAAQQGALLAVRFATMVVDVGGAGSGPSFVDANGEPATAIVARLCERLRVPNECRDLALLAVRECRAIGAAASTDAEGIVLLFERCDAFRRPERFALLTEACAFHDCTAGDPVEYEPRAALLGALGRARGIDTGAIARGALESDAIGAAIRAARVAAVRSGRRDLR